MPQERHILSKRAEVQGPYQLESASPNGRSHQDEEHERAREGRHRLDFDLISRGRAGIVGYSSSVQYPVYPRC